MSAKVEQHSHRSTTKVSHKTFKSRKATKGALKEASKGRIPDFSHRKTSHQQVMSKFDRKNQNRQRLQTKRKELLRDINIFAGRDGAPKIVAIIPLCADCEGFTAVAALMAGVELEANAPEQGQTCIEVERFKQKLQFVTVKRSLTACLDAARVADVVIFLLSADQDVDEHGEMILRSVESQGCSTLMTVVQGLDRIEPPKKRPGVLSSLKSYITHFNANQDKVHDLGSRKDCANIVRSLCTLTPQGIRWRDERSWMLVEDVQWPKTEGEHTVLTGTVRGKGLKADRLVQLGDWGDFQIDSITAAPKLTNSRRSTEAMEEDVTNNVLEKHSAEQDDLNDLAPEEIMMDDDEPDMSQAPSDKRGVLLDDHHYFSDDETHRPAKPKRLPRGTSAYQAAWYLGDEISDSGSDMEDVDELDNAPQAPLPQDGMEGIAPREPTEMAPSEYPQSEMFLDPNPEDEVEVEQLAAFRNRRRDQADEDKEFPDEIELLPNVSARERLARYRGLKSLRTSSWQTSGDRAHEPEDWRRMLQVPDYRSSRSAATREALVGGVEPGTRVQVHIRNLASKYMASYDPSVPLTLFSLLRHEHKRVVANISINLSSEYPAPLKSKETLILQCGPRRYEIRPIFSQAGNTPNDVHKFDRFLHPGGTAVATFMGPLTWGSVPALYYKRGHETTDGGVSAMTLVGTGTCLPPSSNRVVAKRVILTGHPYKIHKKLVTIRYMFFNREDVEWFKALQLWTKRGRSGFIKESLGTHGYFKATFDGRINPQDAVGVSLYKRMWPRLAKMCSLDEATQAEHSSSMDLDV